MNVKKLLLYAAVLLLQFFGIKWIAAYPEAVERYYSTGLFEYISVLFRYLFGWIPFSFGDVMYTAIIIYAIIALVKLIKNRFKTLGIFCTKDAEQIISFVMLNSVSTLGSENCCQAPSAAGRPSPSPPCRQPRGPLRAEDSPCRS